MDLSSLPPSARSPLLKHHITPEKEQRFRRLAINSKHAELGGFFSILVHVRNDQLRPGRMSVGILWTSCFL